MFSKMEIDRFAKCFQEYHEIKDTLLQYCNLIARSIDFDDASDVNVNNDEVCFIANWYGPYQSENHELIVFPISLLEKDSYTVADYLRKQRKSKQEQIDKEFELITQTKKQVLLKLTPDERKILGY